jgi:ribonuclease HI
MYVKIGCDGAAAPHPGPAGAGYVIVGGVKHLGSDHLGDAINNIAEYTAVLKALQVARRGATRALVRMDSQVVHNQITGRAKVHAEHIADLRDKVRAEVDRHPEGVAFRQIPRRENNVADTLANEAAIIAAARGA